jgi:superfamily II DNA or RNA helicase
MDTDRLVEQTYAKKVRITIQDEVRCIISGLLSDHVDLLVYQHAHHVEGYYFQPKYKLKIWDGKKQFFTEAGRTYVNLLDKIIPTITSLGYKVELNDKRTGTYVDVDPVDETYFQHVVDPKTNEPYLIRPYQVDAINQVTTHGNGIVIAGTGAGKSTINAVLVDIYGKQDLRSITIVPNITLVEQTVATFNMFGLDVGEYSGSVKDFDHQHIVSSWQALQNNPKIIHQFQVLVVDECQGAKASVIGSLINEYGKDIVHRFGLTGTLPKNTVDLLSIILSIGSVRYTIPAHELIASGWLAVPNITVLQLNDEARLAQLMENNINDPDEKVTYDNEVHFLGHDVLRRQRIADFIMEKSISTRGNVLCLVTSVSVGKNLKKLMSNSIFLHGKDSQQVRQEVYDTFETNDNVIVIATVQIAGVGLSIDRIFNLIYIDGGKSFVRVIQMIGRGLRKGRDKNSVDVIDICGNLEYSKKHLASRVRYYKESKYKFKKVIYDYAVDHESIDF